MHLAIINAALPWVYIVVAGKKKEKMIWTRMVELISHPLVFCSRFWCSWAVRSTSWFCGKTKDDFCPWSLGWFDVLLILLIYQGKLALMRLYKILFWLLFFVVCVWQAVDFVLALVYRSQTLDSCQKSSGTAASGSGNSTEVSFGGYTTTFLGMEMGDTYGLADCGQAVQAGVIGLAIMLFLGGLFMVSLGLGLDWI